LRLAEAFPEPRVFLATAEAGDAEMAARIAATGPSARRLADDRGAESSRGRDPRESAGVLVVDCLTIWLANVMGDDPPPPWPLSSKARAALRARRSAVIRVSNEVGLASCRSTRSPAPSATPPGS